MKKIFKKDQFYKLIGELLKDFEIIGPKELPNQGIFYQSLTNAKDLYLGEGFAAEPIKKFFLAPSEWLFREKGDNEVTLESIPLPKNKRIIIAARPCEIKGLSLLDKVFTGDYQDPYYINNRERTVIIGLACKRPDKSCFCTSLGITPTSTEGMDVLLVEFEENLFMAELITDRGQELFSSIGKEVAREMSELFEKTKEEINNRVERKVKIPDNLEEIFESNYWDEVSKPCLSCGICTYLCPTCHCFDLVDEERKRLRCYDGCSFPDFTLQASGEDPRPTKKERYRQRVLHKFDYFKKNFGENLCIGCGRCIRYCPVKIDIAEVVDKAPVSEKR